MANPTQAPRSQHVGPVNSGHRIHYILPAIIILTAFGWNYAYLRVIFSRYFPIIYLRTSNQQILQEVQEFDAAAATLWRIDTHAHFIPPFYYEVLRRMGLDSGGRAVPEWNAEDHLALMDKLRIETAILSISTPGARLPGHTLQEARTLAREVNNYGHMMSITYPDRFKFYATLVLPDVEGSIEEAIHALDTLQAAGVALLANSEGQYLGRPEFDPLMEVLNSRGAIIFVHPSSLPDCTSASEHEGGGKNLKVPPPFVVDFLLDTTRAAGNLVMNNVTGRYPNLRWTLAHSGGFLPFAAYRMAGALSLVTRVPVESLVAEFQKFYADTALSSSHSALPSTIAFLTSEHITFGSDFPFAPNTVIEKETAQLDTFLVNLLDQKNQINYGNADRLFGNRLTTESTRLNGEV
ncbi:hypothetical protein R1flu_028542 [Riccia fluitans]|uniref:Amidohydrolase-related domain-containing protein n=1 Tax=Riccia fluitans TaxID=41844 RepID=A0ABD1XLZ6_9MARC